MKKGLFILLLVLAAGIFAYTFSVNRFVASNIEQYGAELTGNPVTVEKVRISPFNGSGTIYGLTVENPDGFSDGHAVSINQISLKVDLLTLISDEVVIEELLIDEMTMNVEQNVTRNNLFIILNHMNEVTETETTETGLIIELFRLNSGTVELVMNNESGESRTINVESFEMTDIGRGGVRNDVYKTVEHIASELAERALEGVIQSGFQNLIDGFRSLFD